MVGHPFGFGQKVFIDGDTSMAMTVTGLLYRPDWLELELTWMANGEIKSAWIPAWRVSSK